MLFSCKISSSVLGFLEGQGEDLSSLLESTSLPEEFLRDPSYWMQANEMESFLAHALQISIRHSEGAHFQKIGHMGPELRSWGVLDSVLRMMPRPQEILAQPERLLAYFISPAPPIDNVTRSENSIEFDLPVSTEQYPLAATYLAASFESLPLYVGQALAACEWSGIHVKIRWNNDQETFFSGVDLGHSLSPELMRNVVATLEKHSKDLEERNRELQAKNEALLASQKKLEQTLKNQGRLETSRESTDAGQLARIKNGNLLLTDSKQELLQNLSRLGDYLVRAQQLMTMLIGQGRMNPQVKEAMKRVDWERVQKQFPLTLNECRSLVDRCQEKNSNSHELQTGESTHV